MADISGQAATSEEEEKKRLKRRVTVVTLLVMCVLVGIILWLLVLQWYLLAGPLALFMFGVLIYLGYTSDEWFGWLGFGKYKRPDSGYRRPRTLWDWLTLLIIPIVLAAGAIGVSVYNLRVSEQQYRYDQQLAATRYANDKQLALESTFQTYLDRMTDLITNPHVHENSRLGNDLRSMATARTLTILPDLTVSRRATVLKFLHDAGLIGRQGKNPNI